MKIAFFHELHSGGARRGTNEFARQLKRRGHVVDLYTIGIVNDARENTFYSNLYFYKFIPKIWKGHDWKTRLYKDTIELFNVCLLDKKIAKIIEKRNYDMVYVAASDYIESPFILNFLKIPTFFYLNDPYYRIIYEPDLFNKSGVNSLKIYYEYVNRFIRKYLDKWNIKNATYIIAISDFANKAFKKAYGWDGEIIYYGVDTNFFKPSSVKKDIDILYIGSKNKLDGYELFTKALRKIKLTSKVREVLVENEWLNDRQLLSLYQRSKILIAPAYREPFGLVPLEAMSCGAVVVAVNDGGHKETVKNGETGYLLEGKPHLFAEKLMELLDNPQTIRKMSIKAREDMLKNWDWKLQGEKLEKLLLEKTHGV